MTSLKKDTKKYHLTTQTALTNFPNHTVTEITNETGRERYIGQECRLHQSKELSRAE